MLYYNIFMSNQTSVARTPEAHDHGHVHGHNHVHGAAHGGHHHSVAISSAGRIIHQPAFSLFALSALQRLLMALPVIALLWLAAFWAMGVLA